MARQFQMSWIAKTATWMKEYKKRKYAVSCRQLGAPPTKEGSYKLANAWWERKKAEIDGYTAAPAPIKPGTPEAIHCILEAWAGAPITSPLEEALVMQDLIANIDQVEDKLSLLQAIRGPERVAQLQAGVDALLDVPAAPPEHSVKAHVEAWQRQQQGRVDAGQLSPDRANNNRLALAHFVDFVGPHADISTIDAQTLNSFYSHCLEQVAERRKDAGEGWSIAFAKDVFSVAKSFVRWAWEVGALELPRNLGSKAFKFGNGAKAIQTWTVAEFRLAVEKAPGKLKLCLLLMANCGMTQQDVSDLLDTEVDWVAGRITRQRSKTAGNVNVPTVQYKLWDVSFRLLQQYRSGTGRVLLTESGLPYVRKELRDGKLMKADGFASNWVHVKKRLKLNRSLKQLRKLGASILDTHPVYGRFVSYFLGHSPRTVADKNYRQPSQDLFDEAVTWLGEQLGQV
jgi:integrase